MPFSCDNSLISANVEGRNNVSIFSKEEIKKAAATITFFVVSTSVSIAGFIFYLNHRIREIKNSPNMPDFNSSFNDSYYDSDNSYSYFTYEYSENKE